MPKLRRLEIPRKREITLPYNWEPRTYQVPVWQYFETPGDGKRAVCVWHRRAGKDLMAINLIATKAFERVGTYWHLLPTYRQGRAIVWNGFTREGRTFLDHFPPELVESANSHEMRVHFKNGSIYQVVGTDDINTLVGTNPIGCVFSEYSLHDPAAWNYIRPILAENGGWAMFIYTPRSRNHGYKLLQDARKAGWFVDLRKAGSGEDATKRPDGTPVIPDETIEKEREAGMPEEMINQEFFISFDSALVGAYYSKQIEKMHAEQRMTKVPWEPRIPVNTYWDIGIGDSTVIIFAQHFGVEHRIIDTYENSGEGLGHYAKILQSKDYVYGTHFAPWDIEVREFTSGRSRIEAARELGIKFVTTPQHSVEDGIEQVRGLLNTCWFDEVKAARLVEALSQYRKEPLTEKLQPVGYGASMAFKNAPLHDWTSHWADAMRIMAWNAKYKGKWGRKKPQESAIDDYRYA